MTIAELSKRIRQAQDAKDYKTVSELWPQLNYRLQKAAAEREKPPKKCKITNKGVIQWPTKQAK